MLERKVINVDATTKRRIHGFSASQISPETQATLQNVNSLDPSKLSSPTESEYY
jgi:hypothetical protein